MARTIVTAGARIGIATLAALGALALPVAAGTAQASAGPVAAVSAECAALQSAYDGLEARLLWLQERLATATPAQKPGLIQQIIAVQQKQELLRQQMDAAGCP